jgi:hypothetical protein
MFGFILQRILSSIRVDMIGRSASNEVEGSDRDLFEAIPQKLHGGLNKIAKETSVT